MILASRTPRVTPRRPLAAEGFIKNKFDAKFCRCARSSTLPRTSDPRDPCPRTSPTIVFIRDTSHAAFRPK